MVWREATVQSVVVGDSLKISQAEEPSNYGDKERRNVRDGNIRALFLDSG